ncbi:hypothetical protein [Bauldia litoralis]|uniref:hypothetical protein n=1 Tax=Bauldia litoralis TaxID=665467 RepID=UPI003264E158
MPVLFFILLIILIATVGFWKTLGAIVGAVAMVVLLVILIAAVAAIGGVIAIKRLR